MSTVFNVRNLKGAGLGRGLVIAGVVILLVVAAVFLGQKLYKAATTKTAVAYFTQHIEKSFWPVVNGGELAVALCFGFLLLVFTGGGAYALDAARGRR